MKRNKKIPLLQFRLQINEFKVKQQYLEVLQKKKNPHIPKTDWYLSLMIKSYHQERTTLVKTLSSKKFITTSIIQYIYIYIYIKQHYNYTIP